MKILDYSPFFAHVGKKWASRGRTALEDREAGIEALTPRQREILRLIAQGHQAKEIARLLGISERTVKTHTDAARRRLGVATSREAARLLTAHEAEHRVIPFHRPPEPVDLSPRQQETLHLIARRMQAKEIARTLGIVRDGHRPPGTMDEAPEAAASSSGEQLSGGTAGATPPRGDLQAWLNGRSPLQWLGLIVAVAVVSALVLTGLVAAVLSTMEALQRFFRATM